MKHPRKLRHKADQAESDSGRSTSARQTPVATAEQPAFNPFAEMPTASNILNYQRLIGNQNTLRLLGRDSAPSMIRRDPKPKGDDVKTPAYSPEPPMSGSIPPYLTDENVDSEGNRIRRSANGKWFLFGKPQHLDFPVAPGGKDELLSINPNASYQALKARCEAIRDEQLEVANNLRGDMKYWFAKVYHYVTKYELEAIEAGTYKYPHMKMQEVVLFNATYKTNLDNWMAGAKDKVEGNWKAAFAAADYENGGTWYKPKSFELKQALLPSMEAHIRFDLPRAMASAYTMHYQGIPGTDMGDFKDDFFKMNIVFDKAQTELAPEMDEETLEIDPGDWDWANDVAFPFFFHVGMEREHAWERAAFLAQNKGLMPDEMQKRLRNSQTARHPMQTDLFDVDDENITDFDWTKQPGEKPDPKPPGPHHLPAPPPPPLKRIYFRYNRPNDGENLEKAVRPDQDLHPLIEFAKWTREVRDADIYLEGHASSEGPDYRNNNLAHNRVDLIEFFLFRTKADLKNNAVSYGYMGEAGAEPKPEWRYVEITVKGSPVSKQQEMTPNANLPSEAK